jgi:hypothetical protein
MGTGGFELASSARTDVINLENEMAASNNTQCGFNNNRMNQQIHIHVEDTNQPHMVGLWLGYRSICMGQVSLSLSINAHALSAGFAMHAGMHRLGHSTKF